MPARLDIVAVGYANDRVASTVVLIRDEAAVIVVDPGMAASRDVILGPLAALNIGPAQVSDVIFSHHHPDHTLNAALFPRARFHDHWAIYQDDVWVERPAEGYEVSPSVRLMETPGHTHEDITTLVQTNQSLVACTHLWWSSEGPAVDPLAVDQELLLRSRARVLALDVDLIAPRWRGHRGDVEVTGHPPVGPGPRYLGAMGDAPARRRDDEVASQPRKTLTRMV
jgi:glyoxylase-like metal-dependent hydrolase (beta-lactamase superfamily II)